jgi:hypothetical protein
MILYRPSFFRAWEELSDQQKASARAAIAQLEANFGRPHLHSGLGIRPFGRYFEFRIGLGIRCLFVPIGGDLVLFTCGNHNQIRRYVRDN